MHGGQAGATFEGIVADAGYALWDGDGGQAGVVANAIAGATLEGTGTDAGHALRDGDGGQAGATLEGTGTNAGHAVRFAAVGDRSRNDDRTRIIIIQSIPIIFLICHSCLVTREVVIDAVNQGIVGV